MKCKVLYPILIGTILFFLSNAGFARQQIQGTVKDSKGIPIPFSTVKIKDTKEGVRSDSTGTFLFSTHAKGRVYFTVSSLNYQTLNKAVTLTDSTRFLHFTLQAKTKALETVSISAGTFAANDQAKGASLSPMDAVTVAGSNADLSQALRALPGAQQIGEQEGLFVRGGTGDETKQFIDGTLNKNPNYPSVPGIQQYARINPFLFKGILFSTGGYSALYGQAMSSALILESVDLPDESSASLHIFPSSMGVSLQQLNKNKKSSFGANFNYSNLKWYNRIISQKPDYFSGPQYIQADANFRTKIGKTGMLKFYTNWNKSNVGMYNPDIDSLSLKYGYEVKGNNWYNNLSYRSYLANNWKIDIGLTYNYNELNTLTNLTDSAGNRIQLAEPPFDTKNQYHHIRSNFIQPRMVVYHQFTFPLSLNVGLEHFYTHDKGIFDNKAISFTNQLSAFFAEGDLHVGKNIALRLGARIERSGRLDDYFLAPRASFAYRLKRGSQLNAAYGVFYQEPAAEFLYGSQALGFSKAKHYILNYTRTASNRFLRLELYYKKYHDLVKNIPTLHIGGEGYARGIELFFRDKKTFKDLDYWLSYTFLHTKRDFLNYPYRLQPTFASPHTGTLAIKKFFPEISTNVNMSYSVAAGRPYYDIRNNADESNSALYDQGRTRAYNVMNLHVAYLTAFFKKWKRKNFSGVAFGVNNLLGTKQVFGYDYSFNGSNKVPITLPAARTFFIGVFMSFGVDRSDNFMDNL